MAKQASLAAVEFNKIKPKTVNQSKFVKAVYDSDIVLLDGCAGTGKTYLTLNLACEALLSNKVEQILITRTIVPCGDIGFLPGKVEEKAGPYFAPHLYYLEKLLGKNFKQLIGQNKILLTPLEVLRGSNYDNTFMIADEIQNFDIQQIKMFLTRMGNGSKIVCLGDQTQSDIGSPASYRFCLNNLGKIKGCSVIAFDESDILRSGIVADVLKVFRQNGY